MFLARGCVYVRIALPGMRRALKDFCSVLGSWFLVLDVFEAEYQLAMVLLCRHGNTIEAMVRVTLSKIVWCVTQLSMELVRSLQIRDSLGAGFEGIPAKDKNQA